MTQYITALQRGDRASARVLLTDGDVTEDFIDAATRLNSLKARANADGTDTVEADVSTSKGEYFITFTIVQAAFNQKISDHFAIKP